MESSIEHSPEPVTELGFDRVLERLREVVAQLETGQLSLEQSLEVYEHGVALARRGHQVLDQAEKRVELLIRDGARGAPGPDGAGGAGVRAVPFEHGDPDDLDGSGEQPE